jgi:hypothetical protein
MSNAINKSAAKMVLLGLVGTLIVLSLVAGIYSILTGSYGDAAGIIMVAFSNALSFVLGFYFNTKGDASLPYGGK